MQQAGRQQRPTHSHPCSSPLRTCLSPASAAAAAPQSLPWSSKVLIGLLGDCVPICGKRRKPYFCLGWLLLFAASSVLVILQEPSINQLTYLVRTPPPTAPHHSSSPQ